MPQAKANYIKAIDVVQARVVQARASVSALQLIYTEQRMAEMEHVLTAHRMSEALWSILELLDQACDASDDLTGNFDALAVRT